MFKIALIALLGFVLLIVLNISLGIFFAFYNRKCTYCGKRMKRMRDKLDSEGHVEEFVFHCEHCGAWEQIPPIELMREQHGK